MLVLQKQENINSTSRIIQLSKITNNQPKPFVFLIMLALQVVAVQSCYSLKSGSLSCEICQAQKSFECTYTNSSNSGAKVNRSTCITYCCNTDTFVNASACPLCTAPSVTDQSGTKLSIFGTLTSVCLFFSLRTWIKKCQQQRQKEQNSVSASAVDLAAYNIDQLGPLYLDKVQNCSICLQSECNIQTTCKHAYHSECLHAWTKKQYKCPLCLSVSFNPVILYCSGCFKQSKLVILKGKFEVDEEEVWQKYSEHKCELCLQGAQDGISFSIQEAQANKKEEPKFTTSNINSQSVILR